MHTEEISYEVEGTKMIGHLALPDGDDVRPCVLVCHEGPGMSDHAKSKADRLAAAGYVAFALDYHGGGTVLTDRAEMMGRLGAWLGDPTQTRLRASAGLDILLAQPRADATRLGAIGFCFGGTMCLELARSGADVKAVVGFHSGLGTARPEDAKNITGSILVCIGADDPMIPEEQRAAFQEEMRAAGVDWRLNLYGGAVHSFTNELADQMGMPAIKYHKATDERSWRAMLDLFDEVLGPL
jgi:dienelactone hydrolase